jgi:hypothetical protein
VQRSVLFRGSAYLPDVPSVPADRVCPALARVPACADSQAPPRAVAYDARVFRSGAHATVALVALAAAVYATASLSGRWLGEPPWWRREVPWTLPLDFNDPDIMQLAPCPSGCLTQPRRIRRDDRETISASIALAGFALFAVASWPRRDRPGRDEETTP